MTIGGRVASKRQQIGLHGFMAEKRSYSRDFDLRFCASLLTPPQCLFIVAALRHCEKRDRRVYCLSCDTWSLRKLGGF